MRLILWRLIELAGLGLILFVIYLAASVPSVREISSTEDDLQSVFRKKLALEKAIDRRQVVSVQFSEAEVAAYINNRFIFEKGDGKGIRTVPTKLQIEFGAGEVVVVLLGQVETGTTYKHNFYLACTGVPSVESEKFVFKPAGGRIGKLPIHPKLFGKARFIHDFYDALFKNLNEEKSLLGRLTSITVNKEKLSLSYEPTSPK